VQLKTPEDYIPAVLERARPKYIERMYGIKPGAPSDAIEFLERLALRLGRLMKGAEPDVRATAKIVLHDWQGGRLPYFVVPPGRSEGPGDKPAAAAASAAGDVPALDGAAMQQSFDEIPQSKEFFDEDDMVPREGPEYTAGSASAGAPPTDAAAAADGGAAVEEEGGLEVTWDDLLDAQIAGKAGSKGEKAAAAAAAMAAAAAAASAPDSSERKRKADSSDDYSSGGKLSKSVGGQAKALKIAKQKKKAEKDAAAAAAGSDSDDGDASGMYKKHQKAPRMKTNKMKIGVHYYATANVKGRKNRRAPGNDDNDDDDDE
jgi:nuclear GTP-binding protein